MNTMKMLPAGSRPGFGMIKSLNRRQWAQVKLHIAANPFTTGKARFIGSSVSGPNSTFDIKGPWFSNSLLVSQRQLTPEEKALESARINFVSIAFDLEIKEMIKPGQGHAGGSGLRHVNEGPRFSMYDLDYGPHSAFNMPTGSPGKGLWPIRPSTIVGSGLLVWSGADLTPKPAGKKGVDPKTLPSYSGNHATGPREDSQGRTV